MSSYGPPGYPGAGQPDDPAGTPGYPGYPPQGPAYPPGAGYPPPGAQPVSGGGYPDPTTPYPSYPPAGGYPDQGQPAGYPPPTSGGGGYPPPPGAGGFPPPPPPPGWGPPPPGMPGGQPPKKSRTGLIIGLVIGAVVLLVLCGCGAIVAIGALAEGESGSSAGDPIEAPSIDVEPTQEEDPASSPPPSAGDSGLIVVGDCVVNDGTDDDAELRKVACEPGSYEVLARIPLTTDTARCDDPIFGHEETDTTYVFDSDQTILDYVLCMKEL